MGTRKIPTPIVSIILVVFGVLAIITGCILLVAAFSERFERLAGFIWGGGLVLSGAFYFGMAELAQFASADALEAQSRAPVPRPANMLANRDPLGILSTKKTADRFFYAVGAEVRGPLSLEKLREMKAAKTVDAETMVCAEESQEWQPLDQVLHA